MDGFTLAVKSLDAALSDAAEMLRLLKTGSSGRVLIEPGIYMAWDVAPEDKRRSLYLQVEGGDPLRSTNEPYSLSQRELMADAIPLLVETLKAIRDNRGAEIQAKADKLTQYLTDNAT